MGAGKALKGAEAIFLALLTIGLIGLLFLIIYGNLAGNLGFTPESVLITNESANTAGVSIAHANETGYTLAGASNPGATGYVATIVWVDWNQSNGSVSSIAGTPTEYNVTLAAANYTVSSTTGIVTNATDYVFPNISISYTQNQKAISERNTDSVIGNLTSGATQFFTFSNVWFILTAITILIGIVLGVIGLVRKASGGGESAGKSSRSEFLT